MNVETSLFEQICVKFGTETIQPYGEVVIVPVKDFEASWKEKLLAERVKIFSNSVQNQSCLFLRRTKNNRPQTESIEIHTPNCWTSAEVKELEKHYLEGESAREISKRMDRTIPDIIGAIRHRVSATTKEQRKLVLKQKKDAKFPRIDKKADDKIVPVDSTSEVDDNTVHEDALGEHELSEEPNPKDPALMRELLLGSLELLNSNKVQAAKILLAEALKDL